MAAPAPWDWHKRKEAITKLVRNLVPLQFFWPYRRGAPSDSPSLRLQVRSNKSEVC